MFIIWRPLLFVLLEGHMKKQEMEMKWNWKRKLETEGGHF